MKREFTLDIDGRQFTVAVERDGDTIRVERDGEEYRVRILAESAIGVQSVIAKPTGSAGPTAEGVIGHERRATTAPEQTTDRRWDVASPMTGVVDQILVSEGAHVAEGERIVVLEAMKMFIDVMAPATGRITQISVKLGDSVREKQPLLVIEGEAE